MKNSLEVRLNNFQSQVFSTDDLSYILGSRTNISRACDQGLVQKIVRGFYGVNAPLGREHLAIIQKYYPDSVICGNSALFFQELSDYDPGPVDLSVPREGSNLTDSEFFTFHRISNTKTSFGIDRKNIVGFDLYIYSPERCLFEVGRRGPNSEEFKKCIVSYFNQHRLTRIDLIREMSCYLSGNDVVMSALRALQESKNIY